MSNVVKLKNKNTAEHLAEEVCADAEKYFIELLAKIAPSGETGDLKEVLLFMLKCLDITRGLIDVIANSAAFDEFPREAKQHFAMQADTMLSELIAHTKKAKNRNQKSI